MSWSRVFRRVTYFWEDVYPVFNGVKTAAYENVITFTSRNTCFHVPDDDSLF